MTMESEVYSLADLCEFEVYANLGGIIGRRSVGHPVGHTFRLENISQAILS